MKNMKKTEAEKRLAAIETEAQKLRELINAPDKTKDPEQGEVWHNSIRGNMLKTDPSASQPWVSLDERGDAFTGIPGCTLAFTPNGDMQRLGTFSEVYIERSEVERDYVCKKKLHSLIKRGLKAQSFQNGYRELRDGLMQLSDYGV